MSLPRALLPWFTPPYWKNTDAGPVFNVGGKIWTKETDLSTLQASYPAASGVEEHTNPIIINSDGFIPSNAIYINPNGYSILYTDADDVEIFTLVFLEDVGSAFFSTSANSATAGTTATSSPYLQQDTDRLIIVDSATNPFVVQLLPASDVGEPLIIKNISPGVIVRATADSTETIEGIAAYYAIPAAVSPLMPTITLLSDGVSSWWIGSGLGI